MKNKKNSPNELSHNENPNWIYRLFQCLDNASSKHWFISSVIIVGASWWFSLVIAFWGEQFGLVQTNNTGKSLTPLGWVITGIIFVVLVLNTLLTKFRKDLPDQTADALREMTASFNLLDKVMSSVSQICGGKSSTQLKQIEMIKNNQVEPPVVYSNPCVQFETILRELVECLAFVLNTNEHRIKADSLYASIAYNFKIENESEWRWVDVQKQQGLDIQTLLSEESTFSSLLKDETKSFEFFNSKQVALEKHKYVKDDCDKEDKDGNLLGSIACFKIQIKRSDKTYIRAILSVSSYDIPFVDTENIRDENNKEVINTRENIRKIIISEFSKRIRIELCNYYIQYLRQKWEKQNP